ncbi:hypothetical protein KSP39_PZI017428 [Platanthera zijinensis]|uniref:Uncharacterized protein n=1 Tax=Platanthera zijinensis TaxID=2320716 RepID=A0AAP0B607_9ASPA
MRLRIERRALATWQAAGEQETQLRVGEVAASRRGRSRRAREAGRDEQERQVAASRRGRSRRAGEAGRGEQERQVAASKRGRSHRAGKAGRDEQERQVAASRRGRLRRGEEEKQVAASRRDKSQRAGEAGRSEQERQVAASSDHRLTSEQGEGAASSLARQSRTVTHKLPETNRTQTAVQEDAHISLWEDSKTSLTVFNFTIEEADLILKKAFGWIHSPYWGEERRKEVPQLDSIEEMLDYLKSLSLSDADLHKILKKFPEVLGCSLSEELKVNVETLEREWGINGKTLRNLLLRNPKVLGYNVDCKGDCMAKCTRCWVRF